MAFYILDIPASPHDLKQRLAIDGIYTGEVNTIDVDINGDGVIYLFELRLSVGEIPADASGANMSWSPNAEDHASNNPMDYIYAGAPHGALHGFTPLVEKGVPLTVSAGNTGVGEGPGVQMFASGPWEFSVAATDGSGNIAGYSDHGTGRMGSFAVDGTVGSSYGTSYAAPRLGAAFSELRDKGFTTPEAHTWLEMNGEFVDNPFSEGQYVSPLLSYAKHARVPEGIGNKATLDAAYSVLMGRHSDGEGLNYWVGEADDKNLEEAVFDFARTADSLSLGFTDTDAEVEVYERIKDHYHLFMGREADEPGLGYWMEEATSGRYGWNEIHWEEFTTVFAGSIPDGESRFTDTIDIFV